MPQLSSVPLWIVLAMVFSGVGAKRINTYAGPYIAYGHRFIPCPSDGSMLVNIRASNYNPMKPYDRQTISGNITFTHILNDSFSTYVDMAIRSANQWKQNAFILNFPNQGCSSIRKNLPDFFRILAKYTGASMDNNKDCAVPRSNFEFHDEPVSWVFPSAPIMPYGRYRFRTAKRIPGASVASLCLEVDCEIIPKP